MRDNTIYYLIGGIIIAVINIGVLTYSVGVGSSYADQVSLTYAMAKVKANGGKYCWTDKEEGDRYCITYRGP